MKAGRGFSLIELLIVIVIAALLAGIGGPAMGTFLKNNRLRSTSFDLLASLNYARSEAISRRLPVVVCRSADPSAATPACLSASGNWSKGWLVFVNVDSNLTLDTGAGDQLLRRVSQTLDTIAVAGNASAADALLFQSDGSVATGGNTAALYVCDERGTSFGREVLLAPHGRAQIVSGTGDAPITACPS